MNPFQQLIASVRPHVAAPPVRQYAPLPQVAPPQRTYAPLPPAGFAAQPQGGGGMQLSPEDQARMAAALAANPGGPLLRNPAQFPALPGVHLGLGQMGGAQPAPDEEGPQGIVYGYANGQTFYDTPQGRIAYALAKAQGTPTRGRTNTTAIARELARRLGGTRRSSGRNQRAGL